MLLLLVHRSVLRMRRLHDGGSDVCRVNIHRLRLLRRRWLPRELLLLKWQLMLLPLKRLLQLLMKITMRRWLGIG